MLTGNGPGGVATNLAETGRSIGMTPEREISETRMAQSVQGGVEMQPEEIGELARHLDETASRRADGNDLLGDQSAKRTIGLIVLPAFES